MKKRLVLMVLSLLLLAGCTPVVVPTGDRAEFDAFVAEVDGARAANADWTQEEKERFERYTPDISDQADALTREELAGLFTPTEVERVSREEALEDIDLFFRLLKSAYGGYDFFGGDQAFLAAKEEMLSRFTENRSYATRDVGIELRTALEPFVQDGHFSIADRPVSEKQFMYYVPNLYFTDTTGLDMGYVKPTIGPDGALTYCFATLSRDKKSLPVQIGAEEELEWVKAQPLSNLKRVAYRRTTKSGVTVLESRTMTAMDEFESQLDRFAGDGASYRDLPTFLVDIRGNGGGSDNYGSAWVAGFAGDEIHTKAAGGRKISKAYQTWVNSETGANAKEVVPPDTGTFEIGFSNAVRAENDSVIFVLTDQNTISAAEGFLYGLRLVNGTVAVGSNTAGGTSFGDAMRFHLPHSGVSVRFGANLLFRETAENADVTGILPDLWVNPADAQDAVLRLIDYYGLREKET